MEKSINTRIIQFTKKGTFLYILIMLVIFPAFFTDMFYLTTDKTNFFLFVTFCYLCSLLPSIYLAITSRHLLRKSDIKADILFIAILLLAVILSTLIASDSRKTFWGISDRSVGGLCFLCCILVYLGIRKFGVYDKLLLWGWLIGSSFLYLSGILCACGIDFMQIQEGLPSPEIYLTPLGNTNYNTCYVCLMLPPVTAMYLICKKRLLQIICGINLYLGFLFCIFIQTESSILAIAAGILILGYFALKKADWFKKYVQITGICLGAQITIALLLRLFESYLYPFNGDVQVILEGRWIFCESVCCLLLFCVYKYKDGKIRKWLAKLPDIALGIIATAIICLIFCMIVPDSFHGLGIQDRSFSNRGFIWKRTIRAVRQEPLIHLLFGNGLNSFYSFLPACYQEESFSLFHRYYLDPHSEWLQMLVDMGLLGLIGYFGLLGATLVRAFRNWEKNELLITAIPTLCVYLIQGFVNAYTIYHLPLLFIFLGMINSHESSIV